MTLAVMIVHHSQFWPTLGRLFSLLAATGGGIATVISTINRRKLQEIHVLVNGNLSKALKGVEAAAIELAKATAERDIARADLAKISTRKTDTVTKVTGNPPHA